MERSLGRLTVPGGAVPGSPAADGADARAAPDRVLRPDAPTVVVVGDLRTVEPRVRALDLGAVEVRDADGNRVR